MANLNSDSLRSAIAVGVNAAFAEFNKSDVDNLIIAPYRELQAEYASALRLAA